MQGQARSDGSTQGDTMLRYKGAPTEPIIGLPASHIPEGLSTELSALGTLHDKPPMGDQPIHSIYSIPYEPIEYNRRHRQTE